MDDIKVFVVGPDNTEIFAAHSESELRSWYINLVGKEQMEEDFEEGFYEIEDIDSEVEFFDEDLGEKVNSTWRRLAEDAILPTQISSGYN